LSPSQSTTPIINKAEKLPEDTSLENQDPFEMSDDLDFNGWDRDSKMPPEMMKRWFGASKETDREITELFQQDLLEIGKGALKHWEQNHQGQLATIILCDQLSRNIFRGQAQAFSFDHISLTLSKQIIKIKDVFNSYKLFEKLFILMPLIHSENVDDCQYGIDVLESIIANL
jgi:uncharacterized protein (DUF924 family)|tara:strand:+ start:128 stop:643 length:516 start_codon:yes stop_codon:yes gene_type:complete